MGARNYLTGAQPGEALPVPQPVDRLAWGTGRWVLSSTIMELSQQAQQRRAQAAELNTEEEAQAEA